MSTVTSPAAWFAAVQRDEVFLDDVRRMAREQQDPHRLHLWWLGQSGFLLQWQGRHLLLDPYLSDSLTRKYARTDKPHVRMSERVVDPGRLAGIDVVTSSHAHTDHLDPETLQPLARVNPGMKLVFPEAHRSLVRERSGLPDGRLLGVDVPPDNSRPGEGAATDPGGVPVPGTVEVGGFRIQAVPAAHEALERDAQGRMTHLGYVVQAGPWTVYHSGDTMLYPGMEERLSALGIDIALLPINGRAPERRVAGNLWGDEAARLARTLRVRWVIPCHFRMFTFNTAEPDLFVATCRRLGQGCHVLGVGERLSVTCMTVGAPTIKRFP